MRHFICIILLCIALPAAAQSEFDLREMPAGWAVEKESDEGLETWIFNGPENFLFRFTYNFRVGTPAERRIEAWVNSASQTVFAQVDGSTVSFSPHDCWPTLGACNYTRTINNGASEQFLTQTVLIGNIRFMKSFVQTATGPQMIGKECFVLDEFGFAKLLYGVDMITGETRWSRIRQEAPLEQNLTQLQNICDAPELLS